jgi:hypothetical protein
MVPYTLEVTQHIATPNTEIMKQVKYLNSFYLYSLTLKTAVHFLISLGAPEQPPAISYPIIFTKSLRTSGY